MSQTEKLIWEVALDFTKSLKPKPELPAKSKGYCGTCMQDIETKDHDCISECARYIKMNVVPDNLRSAISEALRDTKSNIVQLCAGEAGWKKEPKITKEQVAKIRKYFFPEAMLEKDTLEQAHENVIEALKSAGLEVEGK